MPEPGSFYEVLYRLGTKLLWDEDIAFVYGVATATPMRVQLGRVGRWLVGGWWVNRCPNPPEIQRRHRRVDGRWRGGIGGGALKHQ